MTRGNNLYVTHWQRMWRADALTRGPSLSWQEARRAVDSALLSREIGGGGWKRAIPLWGGVSGERGGFEGTGVGVQEEKTVARGR